MMKMRMILLAMTLTISSCTALDILGMFTPSSGLSVDTEIVAGDKSQTVDVTGEKNSTTNTADAITQTYNTVNEQYPWWVLALLILGWVLPSPSQMWEQLLKLVNKRS